MWYVPAAAAAGAPLFRRTLAFVAQDGIRTKSCSATLAVRRTITSSDHGYSVSTRSVPWTPGSVARTGSSSTTYTAGLGLACPSYCTAKRTSFGLDITTAKEDKHSRRESHPTDGTATQGWRDKQCAEERTTLDYDLQCSME
jgi:hypothetical protein